MTRFVSSEGRTPQALRRARAWKPVALALLMLGGVAALSAPIAAAEDADLAKRVAALEAYVGNGDPTKGVASPVDTGVPGPGHNAWMMTSRGAGAVHDAAGPGAVLRRPRAPQERPVGAWRSASAAPASSPSCGGLVGYSFVFAQGQRRSSGGTQVRVAQRRRRRRPTATTPTGSRRTCSRCTS